MCNDKINFDSIVTKLSEGSIMFNKTLALAIGIEEAILYYVLFEEYLQLYQSNQLDIEGWFHISAVDLQIKTSFSAKVQKRLADNLISLDLIDKKIASRKAYYKIRLDPDKIQRYLDIGSQRTQNLQERQLC